MMLSFLSYAYLPCYISFIMFLLKYLTLFLATLFVFLLLTWENYLTMLETHSLSETWFANFFHSMCVWLIYFKIYLFTWEKECAPGGRGRWRKNLQQIPHPQSIEPNVGLHHRTLISWPEPKSSWPGCSTDWPLRCPMCGLFLIIILTKSQIKSFNWLSEFINFSVLTDCDFGVTSKLLV